MGHLVLGRLLPLGFPAGTTGAAFAAFSGRAASAAGSPSGHDGVMLLDEFAQLRVAVNAALGGQAVVAQLGLALVVLDSDELRVALAAALLAVDRHLDGVFEDLDDDVASVANETPLGD